MSESQKNKLFIVGTSLGNIEDISIRAFRFIFETPVILAEDTRVFIKMKNILLERYSEVLQQLNIDTSFHQQIISYREQNHAKIANKVFELLEISNVALFSDAGMPGISDPGYRLIEEVYNHGFEVDSIPGATAVTTALVLSGLPTDRFTFLGFLPRKKNKLLNLIFPNLELDNTVIFYESPFRLIKVLEIISEYAKENNVKVSCSACSEITKKFQKVVRGEVSEVISQLQKNGVKGEWTVCLRSNLNTIA